MSRAQREIWRAALEDELYEPPLTPVPLVLATALERRMADVLGIEGEEVPRLPQGAEPCQQGNQCCWRWLARAALEQVASQPLSRLGLGEAVTSLRLELESLRNERAVNEGWRHRGEQAEAELTALRATHENTQRELMRLREVEKQTARLQSECAELRIANGRLAAQEEIAVLEIARLKQEVESAADRRLAEARQAGDECRQELQQARLELQGAAEDAKRRDQALVLAEAETKQLGAKLATEMAQKRRMQRALDAQGIGAKPPRAPSRPRAAAEASPRGKRRGAT